jgi:hypothetical protein
LFIKFPQTFDPLWQVIVSRTSEERCVCGVELLVGDDRRGNLDKQARNKFHAFFIVFF